MFQKFVTIKWLKHKQEHRIMPVLKFGGMSLTTATAIFGLSDAFCMKCVV